MWGIFTDDDIYHISIIANLLGRILYSFLIFINLVYVV